MDTTDKNGNELWVGDMVRFMVDLSYGPFILGIIEVVDESESCLLYIKCLSPLQNASRLPQHVEKVASFED